MSKGKQRINPKDPLAIYKSREKERWKRIIVEGQEETAGSQSCKRKRLTEVLKAPKSSSAKKDSCNPFHNRTQDRTQERENCTVPHLSISKDREWEAKAPRVGLFQSPNWNNLFIIHLVWRCMVSSSLQRIVLFIFYHNIPQCTWFDILNTKNQQFSVTIQYFVKYFLNTYCLWMPPNFETENSIELCRMQHWFQRNKYCHTHKFVSIANDR